MLLRKLAWEAFMSHCECREGCGRMLPRQRLDGNHLPGCSSLCYRALAPNFLQLSQSSGRRQHLLRITRRSEANVTTLICGHVNTDAHQCCAQTEVRQKQTHSSGQNGSDTHGNRAKCGKHSQRTKENRASKSWKTTLQIHSCSSELK